MGGVRERREGNWVKKREENDEEKREGYSG